MEIEILNFDDDNKKKKKLKRKRKDKNKKTLKKWEKVFLIVNIIFIIITISIYTYRLIYYYKLEYSALPDSKLKTVVIDNSLVYEKDGLYKLNNEYYFRGKDVNNYIWYSGRIWRIVSISNNSIKLITEDSQTSLVWGYNTDYKNSYINSWLNDIGNDNDGVFLDSLGKYEEYLVKENYCVDQIQIDNPSCNTKISNYVGLLSVEEYIKADGKNSYLNNETYWWTSNTSDDNKVWYIFDKGGINNNSNEHTLYYSYGVRPVININLDTIVYSGNGTISNPYVIEPESSVILGHKSVGSYLVYENYRWRIQEVNGDSVKLIMDGILKNNDSEIESTFGSKSVYSSSSTLYKKVHNDFKNLLKDKSLKTCNFYIGNYGSVTNYDYRNVYTKNILDSIGIPQVGSLFVNDYNKYWLLNGESNLVYTMGDNSLYADFITNHNYIRPVICLNSNLVVRNGLGTNNDPLIMED